MTATMQVAALDRILSSAVEAGGLASAVGVLATPDGVVYQSAFGHKNVEAGTPMTADTVCWIGSCTKAVTAIACMQLVEQGRLDLEQPVADDLPELAGREVLVAVENGRPITRPAARPLTLRHLMTHTSGFTYSHWNGLMAEYEAATGTPFIHECKLASLGVPLVFDPGGRWEYGISMELVGRAVERVSGKDLQQYIRAYILDPLGMHDTGYTLEPRHREKLATVYLREPGNTLAPIPYEVEQNPEFFMGGGGMFSTAADYVKILQVLLGGGALNGTTILRPETVNLMMRNHIGDLEVQTLTLPRKSSEDGTGNHAEPPVVGEYNAFPGQSHKWTLSFDTNVEPVPGGRAAGSISWCGSLNLYYWVDPASGLAGLFFSQMLPFPDSAAVDVARAFERSGYDLLAALSAFHA